MANLQTIKELNEEMDEMNKKESKELSLQETGKEGLKKGYQKNGKKYSVRDNRDRFLYPYEYNNFYGALINDKQRITFDTLLNLGARVNEVLHIKIKDIDFERRTIILRKTKIKAKKGEKKPKPRIIKLSTQYNERLRKYCKGQDQEEYVNFMQRSAIHHCIKRTLKNVGVADYYMVSTHNFRKTTGNFLKALGIDGMEICQRLGHDMNTFLHSYGSPDIFSKEDKIKIRELIGDLYE